MIHASEKGTANQVLKHSLGESFTKRSKVPNSSIKENFPAEFKVAMDQ